MDWDRLSVEQEDALLDWCDSYEQQVAEAKARAEAD